jgi:hypothetical protein
MFFRVISRLIAFLLIAESLFGALNFTQLIAQIGIYSPLTIVLILVRAIANACLFVGGWTLANRRPQGSALARYALLASAVVTVFDVGLNLAPTGVYPWWRWQVTGGYFIYAGACIWALKNMEYRSVDPTIPIDR